MFCLQNNLDRLQVWSDTWQLKMSKHKCCILSVGRPDPSQFQYKIGGEPLPVKTTVKDLRITVDSSLKYAEHINGITAKALRRVGLMFKCFLPVTTTCLNEPL